MNVLLQLPRDEWVAFIATKIVGSIALTWVLGITYMLTVTLSVLQLREVLHPDILAKGIRPQVPYSAAQYRIQHHTIQYDTIQYNTIQYNTIQYNAIQYNTIQYNTIQYNTMQYNRIE